MLSCNLLGGAATRGIMTFLWTKPHIYRDIPTAASHAKVLDRKGYV